MSHLPSLGEWTRFILSMPQDGVSRALMPATWSGEAWSFDMLDGPPLRLTIFADRDSDSL